MTLIVLGVLAVPAAATLMVPVAVGTLASDASLATVTVNVPLPVPMPPVIFSHGDVVVTLAVQGMPAAPVIVTATGCPLVMFDSVPPALVAPKRRVARSMARMGPCETTKGMPAIVSVVVRGVVADAGTV